MSQDLWARAFAQQAGADLEAYNILSAQPGLPDCQRLHLLQMACEKVSKSSEYETGNASARTVGSHVVIRDNFPLLFRRFYFDAFGKRPNRYSPLLEQIKRLSREVELLAPAADDGTRRPDNCEYPWQGPQGAVRVPATFHFAVADELATPAGRAFLKVLSIAISRLISEQGA